MNPYFDDWEGDHWTGRPIPKYLRADNKEDVIGFSDAKNVRDIFCTNRIASFFLKTQEENDFYVWLGLN